MDVRAPEVPCGDVLQNAVSDACRSAPWTEVARFRVLEGIKTTVLGVLCYRSQEMGNRIKDLQKNVDDLMVQAGIENPIKEQMRVMALLFSSQGSSCPKAMFHCRPFPKATKS
ncbi:heat shock factor binding protein 1-like 1 [Cricetulus griseus]